MYHTPRDQINSSLNNLQYTKKTQKNNSKPSVSYTSQAEKVKLELDWDSTSSDQDKECEIMNTLPDNEINQEQIQSNRIQVPKTCRIPSAKVPPTLNVVKTNKFQMRFSKSPESLSRYTYKKKNIGQPRYEQNNSGY